MPNIGSVLKEEIVRLSRKEARKQIEPVRKSFNQQRTDIAKLKRDVSALRKQIVPATQQNRPAEMVRFVAKGLKAQRMRLGLSAADYAKLVGVSGQTVYNWEQGAAKPRTEQRATLASLRGIGKRETQARLQKLNGKAGGNGAGHTRG
jgi:DNA-binding transcriptional regulator YiaG